MGDKLKLLTRTKLLAEHAHKGVHKQDHLRAKAGTNLSIRSFNSTASALSLKGPEPVEQIFSVSPEVVNFESIAAETPYYVYVSVKNRTSKQQNLRVLPPISEHFKVAVEGGKLH
jgi:hypothetical protein